MLKYRFNLEKFRKMIYLFLKIYKIDKIIKEKKLN